MTCLDSSSDSSVILEQIDLLYKIRTNITKLKSTWPIMLTDFINVIKSFKGTLNSYRNTKNQKTEKQKNWFYKMVGRKYSLTYSRTEQNHYHAQIMHKIHFRSSFKKWRLQNNFIRCFIVSFKHIVCLFLISLSLALTTCLSAWLNIITICEKRYKLWLLVNPFLLLAIIHFLHRTNLVLLRY